MRAIRAVFIALAICSQTVLMASAPSVAAETSASVSATEIAFEEWTNSLKAIGISAMATKTTYDQKSDVLELTGFTLAADAQEPRTSAQISPFTITFAKLAFTSFTKEKDVFRFSAAKAQEVRWSRPDGRPGSETTIDEVSVDASTLPKLAGLKFDKDRPFSNQISLLRAIAMAELTNLSAYTIRIGDEISINSLTSASIAAGRAESIGMRGFGLSVGAPDVDGLQQAMNVAATDIVLEGVDIDPYLRLFEQTAYLEAGSARNWSNLIREIAATDVRVTSGTTSIGAAKFELGSVKLRRFEKDIASVLDQASIDSEYFRKNPKEARLFASNIRDSFGIGSVSSSNTQISWTSETGRKDLAFSSGTLTNLLATHLDGLTVQDLSYRDGRQALSLVYGNLRDINAPTVPPVADQPIKGSDNAVFPQISGVSLSGLAADTGSLEFSLDRLDLDMSYFIGSVPTKVILALQQLRVPGASIPAGDFKTNLTALGYNDLEFSFRMLGAWQERSSELAFETLTLSVADMGSLTVSGSLAGITRASIQDPASTLSKEIWAGGLKNLRLTFANVSLLKRLLKAFAQSLNASENDIRMALSSNMPSIMGAVEPQSLRNRFIFAGVSFLNEGVGFELVSTNSAVVSWVDIWPALSTPARLPSILSLDARPITK